MAAGAATHGTDHQIADLILMYKIKFYQGPADGLQMVCEEAPTIYVIQNKTTMTASIYALGCEDDERKCACYYLAKTVTRKSHGNSPVNQSGG